MKQVLLAIDGDHPSSSVFKYAVSLCDGMNAELNIIQFLRGKTLKKHYLNAIIKIHQIGRLLEDSFADIAMAEENVPDEKSAPGNEKEPTPLPNALLLKLTEYFKNFALNRLSFSSGTPETELRKYIDKHRDIVLIVFDPSKDGRPTNKNAHINIKKMESDIHIPLVVVKQD